RGADGDTDRPVRGMGRHARVPPGEPRSVPDAGGAPGRRGRGRRVRAADRAADHAHHEIRVVPSGAARIVPRQAVHDRARRAGMNPQFPVYIVSKGRARQRITMRRLDAIGVPYTVIVEPQEHAAYAAVIDPARLLVLDPAFHDQYDSCTTLVP